MEKEIIKEQNPFGTRPIPQMLLSLAVPAVNSESGSIGVATHLRPEFWGQGYAAESANAVIEYAFTVLKANKLFAGHNPNNNKSQKLLNKLGFIYIGDEFYEPTGLYHPSYELENCISHA